MISWFRDELFIVWRRGCHNNSVIVFWTTSPVAYNIIDRLMFSLIKTWSRTIMWITKIDFAGEFSLQYHTCQIISKFWINKTSRRLSSPEEWPPEREAFQTRHEVARIEKRGITPNHYCKKLSSYRFHLYNSVTQLCVATILSRTVWWTQSSSDRFGLQLYTECCLKHSLISRTHCRLCFFELVTKIWRALKGCS